MENFSYHSSSFPESGHSSPRSREIEYDNPPQWEDPQNNQPPLNYKVRFMCSYEGKIQPRPHDNQLSYIGGETKILAVDRTVKFVSLLDKLMALCCNDGISLKYQLPGEDLDALISVTNDDDLDHMMHEYDRLCRVSHKPARLRIFIFQNPNLALNSSAPSFESDEGKTEKERFVDALNSAPLNTSAQPSASAASTAPLQPQTGNVDFLFGLEKGNGAVGGSSANQSPMGSVQELEDPVVSPRMDERLVATDSIQKHIQDLQRLRLEERYEFHLRKAEDNVSGGLSGGEYIKFPENISPVALPGMVPYWADKQGTAVSNDQHQPIYMIPASTVPYHAPMARHVSATTPHGYFTFPRIPSDVYRDQHPAYNMIHQGGIPPASIPPQKIPGYPDGGHMVRTETGYAAVPLDSGSGRPVFYSGAGGLMGSPAAHYQVLAGEGRQTTTGERAGKTQGSV